MSVPFQPQIVAIGLIAAGCRVLYMAAAVVDRNIRSVRGWAWMLCGWFLGVIGLALLGVGL